MAVQTATSTQNKKGFTYSLTSFGKAFVNFATDARKPVVDIGAAYGIATLPALMNGAQVIAVDIEEKHLEAIRNSVHPSFQKKLVTFQAAFPHFDLAPSSISGVYISQVFPFLAGDEIEEGAKKIYDWLIPGGHVFIVSFTPYISHVKSFIPIYEDRKQDGQRWAGLIDDVSQFSDDPAIHTQLPNTLNHVDKDDLKWTFENAGFIVKEVRYFGEEEGALPEGIRFDGRERVGLIAYKPTDMLDLYGRSYWQSIADVNPTRVPSRVYEWLNKPFVLSKALKRVCQTFNVQICDQDIKPLFRDEIEALRCFDNPCGFVRETYLGEPNNPVVYARVSMPMETYLAHKEELDNLNDRPIGETLLYNNPDLKRSAFEIKRVSQNDELLFDALVHHNFFQAVIEKNAAVPELWARRSMFTLNNHKLLITEVFLANLPQYQD